MAGLTVGVMVVPQSMAYAVLLGVAPIYGLYASLVPLLVYPLAGTSRHLATGIIAIDMLVAGAGLALVAEVGSGRYVELAVLLALMIGVIQMSMGFMRLGFVVHLLSRPVIAGFTSAAAIIICFSQLGNLLGIDLPQSQYVLTLIIGALTRIENIHVLSALMGFAGIFLLLVLRSWKPLFPAPLALVILGTAVMWILRLDGQGVDIIGAIPTGLPAFDAPSIDANTLRALLPTAITLALIQFMNVVTLGKIFGAKHRYRIEPNKELLAIGAANIAGSFFRSVPISGSFSRTAVNDQTGARTPMANVVAALLVAATLLFLTPLFEHLPIPVLAAIIIIAAVGLVDAREIRLLIHMKRIDGAIALFTFGATLVAGVVEGILLGIAASVVAIMYRIGRPNVAVLGHLPGTQTFGDLSRHHDARSLEDILLLRVDASLSFTNADYLRELILDRTLPAEGHPHVIIIDAGSINDVDSTAMEILLALVDTLRERGIDLYFGGVKGAVADVFARAGLVDKLGRDHFFVSPHEAVRRILSERGAAGPYLASTRQV